MRADRDPLVAEIRRHNPTKLLVHMRDGEERSVPISGKANRWEKLLSTLSSLAWDSIECLDREGGLLGVVENEEVDDDAPDAVDLESKRDQRLLGLLKEAMSFGVAQTRAQYEGQMSAFRELASSVVSTVRVVQDSYGQAMKVQAAAQAASAMGSDTGDSEIMKMLMMGMMSQKQGATPPPPRMPPRPAPKPAAPAQPTNGVHTEKATAS